MSEQKKSLWKHSAFMKLWAGETVSLLGSQVTLLALPLTAVLVLHATPAEMGLLAAIEFAPFLLFGLLAGVWVDRKRRRPILIGSNIGRALVLASIPVAALTDMLTIEQLYIVGFLVGVLRVFFDVAYQSYLPSLVPREYLVEGNSKLEMSSSVAQLAGPGLAGALVQWLSAPITLIVNSASYMVSAIALFLIGQSEPAPVATGEPKSLWAEIGAGLRVVFSSRYLRSIAACTGSFNLFSSLWNSVYLLYLTRELQMTPPVIGLVMGAGSIGGLIGAALSGWTARRVGLGPAIVSAQFVSGLGTLLIPVITGPPLLAIIMQVVAWFVLGLAGPTYNVNQLSLRQAITPERLQGRMNASMRTLVWGTIPVGSLIGGALGEAIGLRPTLVVGVVGMALAFLWVFFSPVRTLREQPAPLEDQHEATPA